MPLDSQEFLRRFLLHVLPRGFVRIRSFGFLATRRRARLLPLFQRLLADYPTAHTPEPSLLPPLSPLVPAAQNVPLPCLSSKDSLSFLLGNSQPGARTLTLLNHPTMLLSTARASAPTAVVSVLTEIHFNPPLTFVNYPQRIASSTYQHSRRYLLSVRSTQPWTKKSQSRMQNHSSPRSPRQGLRTNPPIANAPAGRTSFYAEAHRRRICDRGLRFFNDQSDPQIGPAALRALPWLSRCSAPGQFTVKYSSASM